MISVKINGNLVNKEMDLGTAGFIVTNRFFKSFVPNCKLDSFTTKIQSFDGITVMPIGKFRAKIEFNDGIV